MRMSTEHGGSGPLDDGVCMAPYCYEGEEGVNSSKTDGRVQSKRDGSG